MVTLFFIAVLAWVTMGALCAWLAGEKGRDVFGWFCLGVLLGPVALLTLGFSPSLVTSDTTKSTPETASDTDELFELPSEKTCPKCDEQVKFRAIVCRFCGHEFGEATVAQDLEVIAQGRRRKAEEQEAVKKEKSIQRQIAVDLSDPEQLFLYMDKYTAYRHEKRATDVEYLTRFIDAGAKLNYRSFFLARTPLLESTVFSA